MDYQTAGTRFEMLAGGFTVEATTRSWAAVFLIPFTCFWAGGSAGHIYGRQILDGQFDSSESLKGLPFLLISIFLVWLCALYVDGVERVTRQGDELEIFTGVGRVGWRRRYRWSQFRFVREELTETEGPSKGPGSHFIVLEGAARVKFGFFLNEERRSFMMAVMRKMLAE